MHIKITVYKPNGKFYADTEIDQEKNIDLFEKDFRDFIRENAPAKIQDGYIVVTDCDDGNGFHNHLFFCNELFAAK